ncbi:MAG: hypothetical protein ACR2P9_09235 [Gammaproteobacteria bacterium]
MNLLTPFTTTKTAVLLVHTLTLTATFALLAHVLRLPGPWFLFGALLALPALATLKYPFWLNPARATGLVGLLIIVAGATTDLWLQILGQQRVDASLHLLVLLLGVLLAITHHLLHALAQSSAEDDNSVSELLEAGLRGPPIVPMLCLALVLGGAMLAYLYAGQTGLLATITPKLLQRGIIPPLTLNLFLWGMALLIGKWLLIAWELKRSAAMSNRSIFTAAHQSSLRRGDSQDEFAAALWQQFEAFYTLPRYINWAIPILGFIGTVLGISLATEGLGELLSSNEADFSQSLGQALEPLGIAFDTTLIALSLSVVFALCQTLLYRWEERGLLRLTEELKRNA